ncbi:Inner nuclear membrane protein SRC1 [Colletotrichum spinosum]|uniref:Inner nuclear membrane protein SRC1 n=1 Tax=Colletotrichum spinosum TaxID=1347390 RepID=A0A4R8PLB5_9PEZI|nr:Inner nuclear membrane protein SRC1 [Colletotrichum spinosum]
MDEYEYLQPGFDPKSLTVPRLRSALVAHDIQYPATAKKPQLIELFNTELVPHAKRILAKQAKAKRSSRGIVDVGSQEPESFDDYDLAPPPPRSTTRSRSPRKASSRVSVKTEEYEYEPQELAATISPTKRNVRATSRQAPAPEPEPEPHFEPEPEPYTEPEPPKSVRINKRVVTPHIKTEESEEDFFKKRRQSEYFSMENPFQSGSSPAPIKTPARRRTAGVEAADEAHDDGARRRTEGHSVEDRPKSSRKSQVFETPANKLLRDQTPEIQEYETVEAGEEFTPDAQFEMEQEMAARGEVALTQRQVTPSRPRRSLAKPFWALAVSLLGAYSAWYRQEKIAVGYCGLGRHATQIIPPDAPVPDWAVRLAEPQCEPCPQHAYCYEDFSVRCESDFILKPHPLALGGLVPLPPTCEPDGEKVRRVKAVADKTVEELRERRAHFECGGTTDEHGQSTDTAAIEEEELRSIISSKRSKKMNKEEFDELWLAAIGDVKGRDEVEVVP